MRKWSWLLDIHHDHRQNEIVVFGLTVYHHLFSQMLDLLIKLIIHKLLNSCLVQKKCGMHIAFSYNGR